MGFSPAPASALVVSVTVGGKQYLLGLYDTAGQVSALAPGLHPFPLPILVGCEGPLETKMSRREGVSARGRSGSSLYFFFEVSKLGKGTKPNNPKPAHPM